MSTSALTPPWLARIDQRLQDRAAGRTDSLSSTGTAATAIIATTRGKPQKAVDEGSGGGGSGGGVPSLFAGSIYRPANAAAAASTTVRPSARTSPSPTPAATATVTASNQLQEEVDEEEDDEVIYGGGGANPQSSVNHHLSHPSRQMMLGAPLPSTAGRGGGSSVTSSWRQGLLSGGRAADRPRHPQGSTRSTNEGAPTKAPAEGVPPLFQSPQREQGSHHTHTNDNGSQKEVMPRPRRHHDACLSPGAGAAAIRDRPSEAGDSAFGDRERDEEAGDGDAASSSNGLHANDVDSAAGDRLISVKSGAAPWRRQVMHQPSHRVGAQGAAPLSEVEGPSSLLRSALSGNASSPSQPREEHTPSRRSPSSQRDDTGQSPKQQRQAPSSSASKEQQAGSVSSALERRLGSVRNAMQQRHEAAVQEEAEQLYHASRRFDSVEGCAAELLSMLHIEADRRTRGDERMGQYIRDKVAGLVAHIGGPLDAALEALEANVRDIDAHVTLLFEDVREFAAVSDESARRVGATSDSARRDRLADIFSSIDAARDERITLEVRFARDAQSEYAQAEEAMAEQTKRRVAALEFMAREAAPLRRSMLAVSDDIPASPNGRGGGGSGPSPSWLPMPPARDAGARDDQPQEAAARDVVSSFFEPFAGFRPHPKTTTTFAGPPTSAVSGPPPTVPELLALLTRLKDIQLGSAMDRLDNFTAMTATAEAIRRRAGR